MTVPTAGASKGLHFCAPDTVMDIQEVSQNRGGLLQTSISWDDEGTLVMLNTPPG